MARAGEPHPVQSGERAGCCRRLPKHLPRALLSIEDIEAILARRRSRHAPGLRDRAMLELLYSTGLRRTELANLQALRRRSDTVCWCSCARARGRKDRVVPLGERAALWLDKYLVEMPSPAHRRRMRSAVRHRLRRAGDARLLGRRACVSAMDEAGIDKPGSCHLFRHACATHMLDNGADIRFIQAMLGHASLSTTERYTHVAIGKLQQIHAATHPAKLKRGSSAEVPRGDQKRAREELLQTLLDDDDDDTGDVSADESRI